MVPQRTVLLYQEAQMETTPAEGHVTPQPVISEALLEALDLAAKLWHDANPGYFADQPYATSNPYIQLAEHAWFRNRVRPVAGLPHHRDAIADGEHVVYVAHDTDGRRLYIGVTSHYRQRMRAHRRRSGWWLPALTINAYRYGTRAEADRDEALAIAAHRPPWNRTY